jgi:hypothetical protein
MVPLSSIMLYSGSSSGVSATALTAMSRGGPPVTRLVVAIAVGGGHQGGTQVHAVLCAHATALQSKIEHDEKGPSKKSLPPYPTWIPHM